MTAFIQSQTWQRHVSRAVLLCMLVGSLSACALREITGEEIPAGKKSDETVRLEKTIRQQKRQIMQLELQLLAGQSEIEQLSSAQEQAIQELVRVKSKLRSRNSKAETVANLAEVKLALKGAQTKGSRHHRPDDLERAQQYVEMSEAALEERNYDGASYLIGQAKYWLRTPTESPGEHSDGDNGASRFSRPVAMTVTKRSNVRAGPGTDTKVLAQLNPGTSVLATGYRGLWVRVQKKERISGWIHYSLLKAVQ